MEEITKEEIVLALPRHARNAATDKYVDVVNACINGFDYADEFRESFFMHIGVIASGRFKMESYANAIKYVTCRMMDKTIEQSYQIVFPDKVAGLLARGADILPYANQYNNGKLVNIIFEQAMIPTHILNQPLHQRAINELADGIFNKNEYKGMAKVKALEALIKSTAAPEKIQNNTLNINVESPTNENMLTQIQKSIKEMSDMQRMNIKSGNTSVIDVAESVIIDVEAKYLEKEIQEIEDNDEQ